MYIYFFYFNNNKNFTHLHHYTSGGTSGGGYLGVTTKKRPKFLDVYSMTTRKMAEYF